MKLIRSSQATLVHVQIKIVELADCLLFIGQVGGRENLTCWSQERKNGDFLNSLQFENDDFYPQKKSNRKSCLSIVVHICYRIILRKIMYYY